MWQRKLFSMFTHAALLRLDWYEPAPDGTFRYPVDLAPIVMVVDA